MNNLGNIAPSSHKKRTRTTSPEQIQSKLKVQRQKIAQQEADKKCNIQSVIDFIRLMETIETPENKTLALTELNKWYESKQQSYDLSGVSKFMLNNAPFTLQKAENIMRKEKALEKVQQTYTPQQQHISLSHPVPQQPSQNNPTEALRRFSNTETLQHAFGSSAGLTPVNPRSSLPVTFQGFNTQEASISTINQTQSKHYPPLRAYEQRAEMQLAQGYLDLNIPPSSAMIYAQVPKHTTPENMQGNTNPSYTQNITLYPVQSHINVFVPQYPAATTQHTNIKDNTNSIPPIPVLTEEEGRKIDALVPESFLRDTNSL